MRGAMTSLTSHVMRELEQHVQDVARKDAMQPFGADFNSTIEQLARAFSEAVGIAFDDMAERVVVANDHGLRQFGIDLRRVPGLEAAIAELRRRNIDLIVKNAHTYADDVRRVFADPDIWGLRVEEIAKRLSDRGDVAQSRAELVARDQTLKMNGQVNQLRQRAAGVDAYIWSTSLDTRVRPEHEAREGVRFDWTSPPEDGHPGEPIMCRCVPLPILPELDEGD